MSEAARIEAVARAMCAVSRPNADPDKLTPLPRGRVGYQPIWSLYEHMAKAAIAVLDTTPSPDSAAGDVESETHVLVDDGLGAAPLDMGSPAEAARILARLTAEWRELRQPSMGTAAEQKKRDIREHNVRFEVANAALNWLWHREHAQRAQEAPHG